MTNVREPFATHYVQLFQSIVKFYETKNFKKALKAADEILAKYPAHSDTLAMKGLVIKATGKVEEGYNLVKEGLMNSKFSSGICWHVMGLMYRDDKNHEQAIKAYMNALRYDTQNIKIMNDLACMQMHVRDYKGLLQTRHKVLQLKPGMSGHWISYAVAQHMAGDRQKALVTIDGFISIGDLSNPYELSEVLLYKNSIIQEIGNPEGTLKHLKEIENKHRDPIYVLETRAKCELQLKRNQEAKQTYQALLQLNSENHAYHAGYQQACGLSNSTTSCSDDQIQSLLNHYDELLVQYPKSAVIKRIPLNFATGQEFKNRLDKFVRTYLSKTIPSLFSAIRSLYSDPSKVEMIQELFSSYESSLIDQGQLPNADSSQKDAPSTLLWTLTFMAHHHDKLSNHEKAMQYVNRAIEHTPTLIELYQLKAKLYKHVGAYGLAADQAELARQCDLADRHLNTKSVKYLLRADRVQEARIVFYNFAKDMEGNFNAHDMQCMWYENRLGESHLRLKKYGQALKQFHNVKDHIEEMVDDQFDFHQYSLRKLVLRSYVEMLRWEDKIKSIHFYVRAAKNAIRTYLLIIKSGDSCKETNKTAQDLVDLEENKKSQKPKKKKNEEGGEEEVLPKKPQDDFGELLMNVQDPLAQAEKFVLDLIKFANDDLQGHLLAIELYLMKRDYQNAIRSIVRARELDLENAELHYWTCRFAHEYGANKNEKDQEVVDPLMVTFMNGDLNKYNQDYIERNGKRYGAKVSVAKVMHLLEQDEQRVVSLIKDCGGASLEECLRGFEFGNEIGINLGEEMRREYPLADVFRV
ncbi:N-alpha-acetyltransferase 16, NatA auxiliary subunit [Acrasis kona]|uniref:N-alpha-acetyltransferase 16, NatA auxiliary subunit n=1 Tax=Acrasis kona TaxID=1008807 RepID=A0AAW2Z0V0_9EUKA